MKKTVTWKRTTALATCALMLAAAGAAGGLATMDYGTAAAADTYTVDVGKGLQVFDGWGLSLSWWATEIGDWTRIGSSGKEKREEVVEALYGESGLNLNIARYNIGGGDDPTHNHMSDDRNTPGWRSASQQEFTDPSGNPYTALVLDDYAWVGEDGETLDWEQTPDYRQLWVLDWIQNEHGENGQDDYISEFYSNSPPYWMTISGCSSGGAGAGQNLATENNQAFVDYFLDVYEYLTSQGFEFGNLQPFNESGSYYWGTNGDQEGCYFSPQQKVQVLYLLQKEMERRGIEVPYNWGDETNTGVAYDQYTAGLSYNTTDGEGNAVRGADVVKGADRYTYHIYSYDVGGAQRMYRVAQQDGKEIYMSEICWSDPADSGAADYDPQSLTTGFHYTQSIIDTVKHGGVGAYIFWQGMEDMVGQMKGNTNYGLIQGVYSTQEEAEAQGVDLAAMGLNYQDFVLAKTYYMSGQYTKYIRPGYQLVDVNEDNTIAAISPDGNTLVLVKQNNGAAKDIRFDLNGFHAQSIEKIVTDKDDSWTHSRLSVNGDYVADRLSDRSITTYVIHGNKTAGDSKFVDESAFQSKTNLDAIKAAFTEGGDTEQFYQTGFSSNGGNAKYYGDTKYAQNGSIAFKFYGTGFAISAPAKKDAGQFDIWVDAEPNGEATYHKDYYSATQANGKTEFIAVDEEGWHTVYMKAAQGSNGSWVNLDGIFIYTSADVDTTGKTLAITSASGVGSTIYYAFNVEGYDGYTLYPEYLNGTEWVRGEALEAEAATGTVENVSGTSVRFRLVAVKDEETVYSAERIIGMLETTDGVLYFVDCGTADPATLAPGATLGTLQSASDQKFGADPATGNEWGYKDDYTKYFETDEAMSSLWSLDKVTAEAIEYEFTIPTAGAYKVALGFFGGSDSGWGERTVKATVNGTEQTATLEGNAYTALFFDVTTEEDGTKITVKVEKSTAEENVPHLSLIAITHENVKLPLYTGGASTYCTYASQMLEVTLGDDPYEQFSEKTFALYYTNGTQEELAAEDAKITVDMSGLGINQTMRATFSFENVECYADYRWVQQGGRQLYYNIDCGYTGTNTSEANRVNDPPEDTAGNIGSKQSTTRDQKYGKDPDSKFDTSWGYTSEGGELSYGDNRDYKWSVRSGDKSTKTLTYVMTGFQPDEQLSIYTGGGLYQDWGGRTYNVVCNGTVVGNIVLPDHNNARVYDTFSASADTEGKLEIKFISTAGDEPWVGCITVWSAGAALPEGAAVTTTTTVLTREGTVSLGGLNTEGILYVFDENYTLTGAIKPEAETMEINVADYLPATSYELHFAQIQKGTTSLSGELVLTMDKFDIEIAMEEGYVRDGEAKVVRFTPVTPYSVTSFTLTTPDGVNYNILDGFYFRATKNGEYTITLVTGTQTVEKTFAIDTIDALDLNEAFSATDWTAENVTVTFAPAAKSGIRSVEIDGVAQTLAETYTITATENGVHTVKVVTSAGFEYERTVTVGNIDKAAPELNLDMRLTSSGLAVGYEALAASGGTLYVERNGEKVAVTEQGSFSLDEEGKYEIYFTSGVGVSTAKAVYYVTYGEKNAKLADVKVGKDGLVTVTEKARADGFSAKLFRAGEEAPIESLKAEKAGKYYVSIESGGEHELLVLYVQSAALGGGAGASDVIGGASGSSNAVMIAGIVIGSVAVVAAVIACAVIMKRRKNA